MLVEPQDYRKSRRLEEATSGDRAVRSDGKSQLSSGERVGPWRWATSRCQAQFGQHAGGLGWRGGDVHDPLGAAAAGDRTNGNVHGEHMAKQPRPWMPRLVRVSRALGFEEPHLLAWLRLGNGDDPPANRAAARKGPMVPEGVEAGRQDEGA